MKNFILIFIFVLSLTHLYQAQSSLKETDNINYQFTIRDSSSNILKNSDAIVEISILQGSESGKLVYSEQKKVKTNINGLASIEIGSGTVIFGDYNKIDWSMSPFYLKTKVSNNNSNLLFNGISKFLSVPYALYSKRAGNGIKNIVGNDNGTLTFVFYDGSTYISPNLKGAQGDKGMDGKNTLINSTIEPSGANCSTGGVKVEYGIDTNNNGVLDNSEINSALTKYVCNGLTGAKGDKGEQGVAGTNGIDGKNTLANTVIEPSGANCTIGGVKIEYGIDLNYNGVLDNNEINQTLTKYVCNGLTGLKGDKGDRGVAGTNGIDGKNTLANSVIEPSGANCLTGGVKIEYGIDLNNNGVLDNNEVNQTLTKYVCNGLTGAKGDKGEQGVAGVNGIEGKNTIANTVIEPSGVNCSTGGVKVEYGIDSNNNGVLDNSEINSALTKYVCNGSTGAKGDKGEQGVAGTNGIDGKNTLAKTVVEPSGANCTTGGVKVEYGIDSNNNGVLDNNEINQTLTKYVCNGLTGAKGDKGEQGVAGMNGIDGKNTIANTVIEPSGVNCSTGGVKVEYGIDSNNNGVLDNNEINQTLTKYVCNGLAGAKGDKGEQGVAGTNGIDGKNTLANTVIEPSGVNCITGGVKIEYGIDSNNNGVLDNNEINQTLTKYVCNGLTGAKGDKGEQGVAGTNGVDAKNTLANTVIEPSGVNCSTGGVKVEYGIDSNNNGVLDNSEINSTLTKYVCNGSTGAKGDKGEQGVAGTNGIDGKNTLAKTVIEPSGANCTTGGVKVEYGIDSNNNGVLDNNEINQTLTKYVCNGLTGAKGDKGDQGVAGTNGIDGKNTLAKTVIEPSGANCTTGGVKVEYGIDSNNNGVLDNNEINQTLTKYVCNGSAGAKGDKGEQGVAGTNGIDGKNTLAKTVIEPSGLNCTTGGVKIEYGIDSNNNGVLDNNEINQTLTKYVCNGSTGAKGDKGEQGVAGTNGIDGKNTLANTVIEPSGANCTTGGVKIEYGIDSNNNGVLDNNEINQTLTKYVCNGLTGAKGTNGVDGLNALVKTTIETAGSNCSNGGIKIETGLDYNKNSVLDVSEVNVSQTQYVCNGGLFNLSSNGNNTFSIKNGFANSTTWICPQGIYQIKVELWGAGGGGGGGSGTNKGNNGCMYWDGFSWRGGSGRAGGLGGYNSAVINVTPGNSYNIIIGIGGTGGFLNECGVGQTGQIGGNTFFDTFLSAEGGKGGTGGNSYSSVDGIIGINGSVSNWLYPSSIPTISYIPVNFMTPIPSLAVGGVGGSYGMTGTGTWPSFPSSDGGVGQNGFCVISY